MKTKLYRVMATTAITATLAAPVWLATANAQSPYSYPPGGPMGGPPMMQPPPHMMMPGQQPPPRGGQIDGGAQAQGSASVGMEAGAQAGGEGGTAAGGEGGVSAGAEGGFQAQGAIQGGGQAQGASGQPPMPPRQAGMQMQGGGQPPMTSQRGGMQTQGQPPAPQQAQVRGGAAAQQQAGGARITVEEQPASIRVVNPPPEIIVRQPAPAVQITQPPPEVSVQQAEPDVQVREAAPVVSVQDRGQPDVQVQQLGQPTVRHMAPEQQQPAQVEQSQPRPQPQVTMAAPQNPLLARTADKIRGMTVVNARGDKLGDVEEVVLREESGEVYVVLSVGGFLGMGESRSALPLSRMQMRGDRLAFTAGTTEGQLEDAADYRPDAYRRIAGDQVLADVTRGSQAGTGGRGEFSAFENQVQDGPGTAPPSTQAPAPR